MSKTSLKERLKKKRDELARKSEGNGSIIFIKEGTIRVRILPIKPDEDGEDQDFSWEIAQFYLGPDVKGVISPATLGFDCPIMEKHKELAKSSDPDDKEIAKSLSPRTRHLIPVLVYTDANGKKPDPESYGKLMLLTNAIQSQIYDFYLDPDWGDMTDPVEGYDIKITRKGSGKTDTEYTVMPMKNSALPKEFAKPVDLRELVAKVVPSYDEAEEKLMQYLGEATSKDDGEDDAPRLPKKKKSKK